MQMHFAVFMLLALLSRVASSQHRSRFAESHDPAPRILHRCAHVLSPPSHNSMMSTCRNPVSTGATKCCLCERKISASAGCERETRRRDCPQQASCTADRLDRRAKAAKEGMPGRVAGGVQRVAALPSLGRARTAAL